MIRFDYDSENKRATEMLSQWRQKNTSEATKEKLMEAFQAVGKGDLAETVKMFGNNFSRYFRHVGRLSLFNWHDLKGL